MPQPTPDDALEALGRCAQWLHHFAALGGCQSNGPAMTEVRNALAIIDAIGNENAKAWAAITRGAMKQREYSGR